VRKFLQQLMGVDKGLQPPGGYQLWLDGQDPELGPYIDGSGILHWPDKSGNNYSVYGNSTGLILNTTGGYKYVSGFQNANPVLLVTPLMSAYIAAGWAIYTLAIPNLVPTSDAVVFSTAFTSSGPTYGDIIQVGTYSDGRARLAQGSTARGFGALSSLNPCTLTVPQLWRFRQGAAGANLKIKVSGQTQQNGTGVGTSGLTNSNDTFIGQTAVGGDAFYMNWLAEFLMYPTEISDTIDTQVGNYFVAKYGVAA
jgi:hypothetical protein